MVDAGLNLSRAKNDAKNCVEFQQSSFLKIYERIDEIEKTGFCDQKLNAFYLGRSQSERLKFLARDLDGSPRTV